VRVAPEGHKGVYIIVDACSTGGQGRSPAWQLVGASFEHALGRCGRRNGVAIAGCEGTQKQQHHCQIQISTHLCHLCFDLLRFDLLVASALRFLFAAKQLLNARFVGSGEGLPKERAN